MQVNQYLQALFLIFNCQTPGFIYALYYALPHVYVSKVKNIKWIF